MYYKIIPEKMSKNLIYQPYVEKYSNNIFKIIRTIEQKPESSDLFHPGTYVVVECLTSKEIKDNIFIPIEYFEELEYTELYENINDDDKIIYKKLYNKKDTDIWSFESVNKENFTITCDINEQMVISELSSIYKFKEFDYTIITFKEKYEHLKNHYFIIDHFDIYTKNELVWLKCIDDPSIKMYGYIWINHLEKAI